MKIRIDWKNKKTWIIGGIAAAVVLIMILCIVIAHNNKKKAEREKANTGVVSTEVKKPPVDEAVTLETKAIAGIEGSPCGVAVRKDGSLLVTDSRSKVLWSVKNGTATVIAGKIGPDGANGEPMGGYSDAWRTEAKFAKPWGVASFLDGFAVSDSKNQVIRYYGGDQVRTAAYKGSERTLINPAGLTSDDKGNLYVADAGADAIYKMDQQGIMTMVADGLSSPSDVCWSNGILYVADTGSHRILSIQNGLVSIVAGSTAGFRDGSAEESCFQNPQGVTVGEDGQIYVADTGNSAIRVIKKDGTVKTLIALSDDSTWPVAPIDLTPYQGGLVVVDEFSGVVFQMPYVKD